MRHLIKWNESKSDLYFKISNSKRREYLDKDKESFTKREIGLLTDLCEEFRLMFVQGKPEDYGTHSVLIQRNPGSVWCKNVYIYKITDEWFVVTTKSGMVKQGVSSYLCDTIDGVIECMKKENIAY